MRARKLTAALAAVPLILASAAGVAHADIIENTINVSPAVASITAGSSVNVGYRVQSENQGADGQQGCNAADSTPLSLTLLVPQGVSVSGSTLQAGNKLVFTQCGQPQTLTFRSATPGEYLIGADYADGGTGRYTDQADWTLKVTAPVPTNTKPSITISGVTADASYEIGSEPSPICNITDTEDGNSTKAASVSPSELVHGLGSLTATCAYTDQGGLAADTVTATYTIVDSGDPIISHELTSEGAENENGWYNKDVTVTFTCADPRGSGIQSCLADAGPGNSTILGEGEGQSVTGTATDWADNSATDTASGINIDKTSPTVSSNGVVGATSSTYGWYNADVTVEFKGVDALSGLAEATKRVKSTGEGAAIAVTSPAFTDLADNTTPAGHVSEVVKIDKTAPTDISFVGGPTAGIEYYENLVPAAPECTADDALSGLAGCEVTGYSKAVGTQTLVATAVDKAGNVSTSTRTYKVRPNLIRTGFYAPVDKGIHNTVKAGATVPLKFEVFDGSTELTGADMNRVTGLEVRQVSCESTLGADAIEELASVSTTTLRYDTTAGQFIQTWKTPAKPLTCYETRMVTADGLYITALFKLK